MGKSSPGIPRTMEQKVTLVTTVKNEEESIIGFLDSVMKQTKMPNEVIIVDGGSTDKTIEKCQMSPLKYSGQANVKCQMLDKMKIIRKRGNRSVGRNTAIKASSHSIIAVTDAGCILDPRWLERIIAPFKDRKIDVVAGFYKGKAETVFQKCVVPYALVMPDKVNPNTFLPATRSLAFRKSVWKKVGGFNKTYSHNEDYVFARELKRINARIFFKKNAIVNWIPRKNLSEFYVMCKRFAYGDAEAGIYRPKVIFILARYLTGLGFLGYILISGNYSIFYILYSIFFFYLLWSILKNYKYVNDTKAIYILPTLQITSDLAVLIGTVAGFLTHFNKVWEKWAIKVTRKIKPHEHFKILSISLFISVLLFTITAMLFSLHFPMPKTTAINWYTIHKYPKQMDYFYFEFGFLFITLATIGLWYIFICFKIKKS